MVWLLEPLFDTHIQLLSCVFCPLSLLALRLMVWLLWSHFWRWRSRLPLWHTPCVVGGIWKLLPYMETVVQVWATPLVQVKRIVMQLHGLSSKTKSIYVLPQYMRRHESLEHYHIEVRDVTLIPFIYKPFCSRQCAWSRSLLVSMGIHRVGLREGPQQGKNTLNSKLFHHFQKSRNELLHKTFLNCNNKHKISKIRMNLDTKSFVLATFKTKFFLKYMAAFWERSVHFLPIPFPLFSTPILPKFES